MGLRSRLLEIPIVYEVLQNGLTRPQTLNWLVDEVLEVSPGLRVLDVGCGPAGILSRLPEVDYVGIDHNRKYIEKARSVFGSRGRFEVLDVNDPSFKDLGMFDLVMLIGVLHHLTDAESHQLMRSLSMCLSSGGRLVTFDCGLVDGQHPIARFLSKVDRGRYSRTPKGYRSLIEPYFVIEQGIARHDLLRVPYTHVIFRARAR